MDDLVFSAVVRDKWALQTVLFCFVFFNSCFATYSCCYNGQVIPT